MSEKGLHLEQISDNLSLEGLIEMPEDQNIEWKESWRDEYLKWVCGFANAQGGRIYIGVNDGGSVVGIADYHKLLEDIPNKIHQTLGIVAEVNLLVEKGLQYIEINVAPSSFAVNYKGEYHYRCGSTKQQLKGTALTDFLLRKSGSHVRWDAQPAPYFSADELDVESFEIFRNAAKQSGRINDDDLQVSNEEILHRLNLFTPEHHLKRAAVLLFHRQPERLVSGCYVKLAKCGENGDLLYQEEIRGSLFIIAERLMEIIYLKYLTAEITYQGNIRVENYPYPKQALREIIFNALIHCNWSAGEPVYVKITDSSLSVSNVCVLPPGWSQDTLVSEHKSKPYNPDIANTFFRAGYVEIWGRGVKKVIDVCKEYGLAEPDFELRGEDITVTLHRSAGKSADAIAAVPVKTKARKQPAPARRLSPLELLIVKEMKNNSYITLSAISKQANVSKRNVQYAVNRLSDAGILKREGSPRKGYWVVLKGLKSLI